MAVRASSRVMSEKSGFFATVDPRLLQGARRGDRAAWEKIYRNFERPVHTLAYRLCGTREEAEEILQETFLEVVRSLGSFRGEAPFGAWLRRVAISKILNRRRRAHVRRLEVRLDDDPGAGPVQPVSDALSPVRRIDLERALAELGETSRIVVWLHDVEGLTHAEIGSLMGRSPSFSKSRLSRAHARLRQWMTDSWRFDGAPEHRTVAGAAGG